MTDADAVLEALTHEQWAAWQARHEVMPLDHTEKMLGFIAWMLAKYLGLKHSGDLEELCMPWVDQSDEALLRAAIGERK